MSDIGCPIRLFADDTSLYIVVDSPPTAANFLNADLCAITNWVNNWLVPFNASRNVSMTISRKANPPQYPPLFMNNVQLTEKRYSQICRSHFLLSVVGRGSETMEIIDQKPFCLLLHSVSITISYVNIA